VGKTKRGKGTKIMAIAAGNSVPVAVTIDSASPHESILVDETLPRYGPARLHEDHAEICMIGIYRTNSRGQTVFGVVRKFRDCIEVGIVKGLNAYDRTEDFFAHNLHRAVSSGKNRRFNQVPLVSHNLAIRDDLCAEVGPDAWNAATGIAAKRELLYASDRRRDRGDPLASEAGR
jgi:hypothetical protein